MQVRAELFRDRRMETVNLPAGSTAHDLLRHFGLASAAHLVVRRDIPLPLDEPLLDGEKVVVLSVVSGGT